jgi:uncharacterized membrane protein YfcA
MRELKIQIGIAFIAWAIWLSFLGLQGLEIIKEHITIALTMLLGSFVAGSTSVGGGAIAFPIFTKVLHIDSTTALIFSLAIQSIGMTAASLMIFMTKTPICFRVIRYSIIAGGLGLLTSFFFIRLQVSSADIKYLFSSFSFLIALGLIWTRLNYENIPHSHKPQPGKIALIVSCFIGGMLSGIIGTGIDFILFSMMIFIWRYDFKKAIATSVVVMAFNAVIGFTAILTNTNYFKGEVVSYWLAAVPIVVVGAPLGAIACRYIHKHTMMYFLLTLISVDILSTIFIIGIKPYYLLLAIGTIIIFITYQRQQEAAK